MPFWSGVKSKQRVFLRIRNWREDGRIILQSNGSRECEKAPKTYDLRDELPLLPHKIGLIGFNSLGSSIRALA